MSSYYEATSTGAVAESDPKTLLYNRQQYDSGFSDTFSSIPLQAVSSSFTSVPPAPPHLIGGMMEDVENSDSGICDDVVEIDRAVAGVQRKQVSSTPMEVDSGPVVSKMTSRGSASGSRSPVSKAKRAHNVIGPRIPKKTVHGPFSVSSSTLKTVSARSASPKSVYTTEPHSSTHVFSSAPFTNKENQGPSSMPAMRSGSPLTCSNFRSLNVDNRVPPIGQNVSIDIFQLREYMNFFLPDTKEGDTGFHLAVIHNQPDLLDKLLFIMSKDKSLKSVIDEQNCLFQTALHLATHLQQLEMIRRLLLAGASIDITDHKGNTPLHIAAKFSSTRPLEEIIKYVSIRTVLDVAQTRNNEGLSCVHIAAKNGNMEILRRLHNLGVDMDMQDFNSGKTALHLAAENNSLANVQFLLETCDADVNCLTYSGCSPLHIAAGRSDISVVAYLISMGADPELCTDEGDVALELAGSEEVNAFLTKVAALKLMFY